MNASGWAESVRLSQEAKVPRQAFPETLYATQRRDVYPHSRPHPNRDPTGLHPVLGRYRDGAKVRARATRR